ncbi:hypothetical protein D3C72_2082110 [compost metagenome]
MKNDPAKAAALLDWEPVTDFAGAMEATMAWYAAHHRDALFEARAFTLGQIDAFERAAIERQAAWARLAVGDRP